MKELTPQQALTNLTANPKNFLGTYPIAIVNRSVTGSDLEKGDAGAKTVYILKENRTRSGSILKKRMHNWYQYNFLHQRPQDTDIHGNATEYTACQAYYVPISWSDDPHPAWCEADNDPVIMITGQLSGCSFIVKAAEEGGELRATHFQPTIGRGAADGMTGAALNTALVRAHEDWAVFGANNFNSDASIVNVIGVRHRTKGWSIYAQTRTRFGSTWKIESVKKIYP